MENKEIVDNLKYSVNRFDHYYDSVNNKGNVFLAINTFILSGALAGFFALDAKFDFHWSMKLILTAFLGANLISFLFILSAIKPFLKKNGLPSMFYFGDLAKSTEQEIHEYWTGLNDNGLRSDMIATSKNLSVGLSAKFNCLSSATNWTIVQVFVALIFVIILIIQY